MHTKTGFSKIRPSIKDHAVHLNENDVSRCYSPIIHLTMTVLSVLFTSVSNTEQYLINQFLTPAMQNYAIEIIERSYISQAQRVSTTN